MSPFDLNARSFPSPQGHPRVGREGDDGAGRITENLDLNPWDHAHSSQPGRKPLSALYGIYDALFAFS